MTIRGGALISIVLLFLRIDTNLLSAQVIRLPASDVALSSRPQVSFTVGVEDGRDWEVFADVGDVAFDSKDNLYVLDRGNARVVAFDSTGHFLRVFGRRGNGPGEFTIPQRMTVTRGDEVVVSDVARQAFSVFGLDGAFRRSVPYAQGWVMTGSKLAPHSRGGVVSFFLQGLGLGSSKARVLWQPLGHEAVVPLFTAPIGATAFRSKPVFSPSTRFAVLPSGALAVASTEAYSVEIIGPNGSASRVLERAIKPRRVTARDQQQEKERREALARPGGLTVVGPGASALPASARAQIARQLQDVEFAAVIPVIQALEIDAEGNLWIQRAGPALDRLGPIDIVTPQGRYVGTLAGVRLPTAFSARGRAAYEETDELGVVRVVVLRLPPRWR